MLRVLRRSVCNMLVSYFGQEVLENENAWELVEGMFLQKFLRAFKIDCVFDVGANLGEYAVRLRNLGFRELIISFEPNPDVLAPLTELSNKDEKWIVIPNALDATIHEVEFNIMKRPAFSSFHEPDHSRTTRFSRQNVVNRKIKLTTQTLKAVLPSLQSKLGFSRPFLKLDTQGHDTEVIKGAGESMRAFVGLQSELSFLPLYREAPLAAEAIEIYRREGFRLSALLPNTGGHFPDLYEADCIMYNTRFKRSPSYRPAPLDTGRVRRPTISQYL